MEETHRLDDIDEDMDYNEPGEKEAKKKTSIDSLISPEAWDELIAEFDKEEAIEEEERPSQFELFKGGTQANITKYIETYFQTPRACKSHYWSTFSNFIK